MSRYDIPLLPIQDNVKIKSSILKGNVTKCFATGKINGL